MGLEHQDLVKSINFLRILFKYLSCLIHSKSLILYNTLYNTTQKIKIQLLIKVLKNYFLPRK